MLLTGTPVIHCQDIPKSADFYKGVYETDPHFYELFKEAGDQGLASVFDQIATDPSSDFYRPLVARIDQRVLGFLYAYPLREMFSRQACSLRYLISLSENPRSLRPTLASLGSSKGKIIHQNSFYLTRVYVMPNERGAKVGESLMDFYQAKAIDQGMTALSLHVRTENVRAQRFYARLGFEFSDSAASGYLSMEKAI